MRSIFYGWWIAAGVVGIQFLLAALMLQAFGTYAVAWREEFGWSTTAIALAYSLRRTERGLLAPLQGWLLRRYGARPVMAAGMAIFGIGLILLGRIGSLAGFFGVFAITSLGASMTGILSSTTVLVQWFERRRSTALALMNTGKSLGGLAVPVVAWAIASLGWRTSVTVAGVVALTAGIALTFLMRDKPERYGLGPDGSAPRYASNPPDEAERSADSEPAPDREDPSADDAEPAFSTRDALATRAFWLVSAGHALAVAVVASVVVHAVVYLEGTVGFPFQTAANFFAVMTGSAIGGQVLGAYFGDRFDRRKVAAIATLGHAAGVLALALATSTKAVLAFALLHGGAWGVRAPQMAALRADWFGRASFATIMGFSTVIVTLGAVGGPVLVGLAGDAGAFRFGFLGASGVALIAGLCFLIARPPEGRA